MHHSRVTNSYINFSDGYSNASTKPSTCNDEKEPVPSFLKVLSYNQKEFNEDTFINETFQ